MLRHVAKRTVTLIAVCSMSDSKSQEETMTWVERLQRWHNERQYQWMAIGIAFFGVILTQMIRYTWDRSDERTNEWTQLQHCRYHAILYYHRLFLYAIVFIQPIKVWREQSPVVFSCFVTLCMHVSSPCAKVCWQALGSRSWAVCQRHLHVLN